MGTQTQHKARPQVGHPNATQGTSARWAPQRNARHARKLGGPTQVRNANARHVRKLGGPTHVRNANARHAHMSASWAPQRNARHICTSASCTPQPNARHVRKLDAQTQHKTRPQVGCPNATQGTSASWAPQRRSATQMQGTSARPQVGRSNATQGTSARWSPKRKTIPQRKRPHKGALG